MLWASESNALFWIIMDLVQIKEIQYDYKYWKRCMCVKLYKFILFSSVYVYTGFSF